VGSRASLNVLEQKRTICARRDSNHDSSERPARRVVTILTTSFRHVEDNIKTELNNCGWGV